MDNVNHNVSCFCFYSQYHGAVDIRFALSVRQLCCVCDGLPLYAPLAVRIMAQIQTKVTQIKIGNLSKIGISLNGLTCFRYCQEECKCKQEREIAHRKSKSLKRLFTCVSPMTSNSIGSPISMQFPSWISREIKDHFLMFKCKNTMMLSEICMSYLWKSSLEHPETNQSDNWCHSQRTEKPEDREVTRILDKNMP